MRWMVHRLTMTVSVLLLSSRAAAIGVNWGTASSHPLPPPVVVQLLRSNRVSKVRLLDADPVLLQALPGSDIDVTVGIPNVMLRSVNSSLKAAESWVHDNVTRYFSGGRRVRIECAPILLFSFPVFSYCLDDLGIRLLLLSPSFLPLNLNGFGGLNNKIFCYVLRPLKCR